MENQVRARLWHGHLFGAECFGDVRHKYKSSVGMGFEGILLHWAKAGVHAEWGISFS
jgi:hypothetical protein